MQPRRYEDTKKEIFLLRAFEPSWLHLREELVGTSGIAARHVPRCPDRNRAKLAGDAASLRCHRPARRVALHRLVVPFAVSVPSMTLPFTRPLNWLPPTVNEI